MNKLENLDDYDVIFIGYPIWWYTMPQAMYSFFEEYDFSGKTIIPFDTHYGSGNGGSKAGGKNRIKRFPFRIGDKVAGFWIVPSCFFFYTIDIEIF